MRNTLWALLLCCCLSACGNKGDLYLPDDEAKKTKTTENEIAK